MKCNYARTDPGADLRRAQEWCAVSGRFRLTTKTVSDPVLLGGDGEGGFAEFGLAGLVKSIPFVPFIKHLFICHFYHHDFDWLIITEVLWEALDVDVASGN